VPELSRFQGIVIGMFFNEHGVPHFHATHGDDRISVEIESGAIRGRFPAAGQRLVLEWAARHRQELLDNWTLAHERKPLVPIAPLE
jgi:hypothetical protein